MKAIILEGEPDEIVKTIQRLSNKSSTTISPTTAVAAAKPQQKAKKLSVSTGSDWTPALSKPTVTRKKMRVKKGFMEWTENADKRVLEFWNNPKNHFNNGYVIPSKAAAFARSEKRSIKSVQLRIINVRRKFGAEAKVLGTRNMHRKDGRTNQKVIVVRPAKKTRAYEKSTNREASVLKVVGHYKNGVMQSRLAKVLHWSNSVISTTVLALLKKKAIVRVKVSNGTKGLHYKLLSKTAAAAIPTAPKAIPTSTADNGYMLKDRPTVPGVKHVAPVAQLPELKTVDCNPEVLEGIFKYLIKQGNVTYNDARWALGIKNQGTWIAFVGEVLRLQSRIMQFFGAQGKLVNSNGTLEFRR